MLGKIKGSFLCPDPRNKSHKRDSCCWKPVIAEEIALKGNRVSFEILFHYNGKGNPLAAYGITWILRCKRRRKKLY
jgi:hypothetical protein